MRARLILLLIATVVAGIVIYRKEHRQAASVSAPVKSPAVVVAASPAAATSETNSPAPVAGIVVGSTAPEPHALDVEFDEVKLLIRDYRLALGENPVGSNAEITRALMGANAKQTKFVMGGDVRLNGKGELVDPWRTPYFFHQLSAREMEIRSAGPDKRMWTSDDIVLR